MPQPYTWRMQIEINPEVEALVNRQLSSGRFHDQNELLATALLMLADTTPADLDDLEVKLAEGVSAADRGDLYDEAQARPYLRSVRPAI